MMETKGIKENKLKTILQFSVPSIIAMLLQTAITITDGYFTGNYVGENALAAINLGLPILYFYLGVGLCVGVGGTVICGRLLGAKDTRTFSSCGSTKQETVHHRAASCFLCLRASEKLTQTTEKAAYRKMGRAGKMKM